MTSHKQSRLMPKLRFAEFQNEAGWAHKMLRQAMKVHGIKSDGKSEVHSVSLTKGIVSQIEHLGRSFAASDTKHYSLVRPFDIVYTRSPLANYKLGIVKQHKGKRNAIVSPLYGVFEPKNRHLGTLIEAYFDSPSRNIRSLDPLAQKGAKNTIQLSNDRFLSGQIFLPENQSEQQKIADFISSLDKLIAAEGRKLEALRQHKQGLMQQLFPKLGETVPCLRFPEFRDKWRKMRLDSVVTEFRASSTVQDEYEVLTSARSGLMRQVEYYGEGRITDRNNVGFNIIPPDHLTYRSRSDDDRFFFNHNHLGITGIISVYYPVFRSTSGSNVFLAYLLNRFSREIGKHSVGTSQTVLSMSALLRFALPIPEAEEQQKIADCLGVLDDLIAAEDRKLNTLRQHKQGLMQQLFPSLDGNEQ